MRFLSYISIMVKNLDQEGLKSIINRYDLFFIDLWGVVHNGIELYENSINVLDNLAAAKKDFVLLTNAPRPNATVINFLKKMGLKKYFENVFTSGEAAHKYLISELGKKNPFCFWGKHEKFNSNSKIVISCLKRKNWRLSHRNNNRSAWIITHQ